MSKFWIAAVLLIALAGSAHAFGLGLGNRFGRLGAMIGGGGSSPPSSNILLSNTGSALLVNTGVKFLVQ